MSAILRAVGHDFDVDAYMPDCTLPEARCYRRGDPVGTRGKRRERRNEWSGVHADASDADFDEFQQQVLDATQFLTTHADELRRLVNFPGVEAAIVDFGIWRRDVCAQCDQFPPALVRAAGALGVGLELTVYSPSGVREAFGAVERKRNAARLPPANDG